MAWITVHSNADLASKFACATYRSNIKPGCLTNLNTLVARGHYRSGDDGPVGDSDKPTVLI
jgi:hypothetical protein